MVKNETIHRMLAICDPTRDPYSVTDACAALLESDPNDARGVVQYLRGLVALGLGGMAKRLWANISSEPLGPSPAGVIAWASRKRRFAANLAVVEQRWPEAAIHLREWESAQARYELHQSGDGNYHVLDQSIRQFWNGWQCGLKDHRKEAALFAFDKETTPMPGPVVFDGTGYGWLLLKLLTATQNSYLNYSCAVYIVEPDSTALAIFLHLHDLREWLGHPRLRLFAGPTAKDDFAHAVRTNRHWTPPQQYIENRLISRPALGLDALCGQLQQELQEQTDAAMARARQVYAGYDMSHWRKLYSAAQAGKRRLRVLGVTTRYSTVLQHSMAELGRAIEAAGHQFKISMEADDQSLESPVLDLIGEFKPDLLVQISRLRYENPRLPREIPCLCWDQDNLPCMRNPAAAANLDALTYVAGHGAIFGYGNLQWPLRNCIFCQPAGATDRYSDLHDDAGELERYACDISFVSNASGMPSELRDSLLAPWADQPQLRELFMRTTDTVLQSMPAGITWGNYTLNALIRREEEALKIQVNAAVRNELLMNLTRIADRCFRHGALLWAHDWCRQNGRSLKLYGNGWDRHPALGVHAAGPAAPGEELRCIYRASKINLQLIETGFIHSRSLDGLAAGGFFLTRRTADDVEDVHTLRAVRELCALAAERGLTSVTAMEGSPDPEVQSRWKIAKALFANAGGPETLIRALPVWREMTPASEAWPCLPHITFHDVQSFAACASRYLDNRDERQRIAAQMRAVVLEKFSYHARWKKFLAAINQGLAAA